MSAKKRLLFLCFCLLVVIVLGLSYAYFRAGVSGLESNSTLVLNSGTLDIVYADGDPDIILSGISPQDEPIATKTFTVTGTNTTDLKMQYAINLIIDINTFSNGALVYELVGSSEEGLAVNSSGSINGNSYISLGTGIFMKGTNIIHSYSLKIYFPDTGEDQSIDKGKSIALHIGIDNQALPLKGDLITMDVGDGLPTMYRILSLDGNEALVLAMQDYNIGETYSFGYSDGDIEELGFVKYEGSYIDELLNSIFYNQMNSDFKSSVVPKNINQNILTDGDGDGTNGVVNVGERYIYLLDVDDIFEYLGNDEIDGADLNMMFFNQETDFNGNSTMGDSYLWLRTASADRETCAWAVKGYRSDLSISNNGNDNGIRPAFVVNLAEISYNIIQPMIINFNNNGGTGSQMSIYRTVTDSSTYFKLPLSTMITPPGNKVFKGWSLSLNGAIVKQVTMDKSYELYAIWGDPGKGDIVTLNVGEGLPDTYRVLKIDGTEALVLSMQNYASSIFNSSDVRTSFSGTSYVGPKYEDSDLDILLNTTMYSEMNNAAKSAIIPQNINQSLITSYIEPYILQTESPYSYEYQFQRRWSDTDWGNLENSGSVNIGYRNIFTISLEDIFDYSEKRYITSSELNALFLNQETKYFDTIWLRSAYGLSNSKIYVWIFEGYDGDLDIIHYSASLSVRPAFVIDLSKMGYFN